jgi:hypothetical protein
LIHLRLRRSSSSTSRYNSILVLVVLLLDVILLSSIATKETEAYLPSDNDNNNKNRIMRAWNCHGRNQRDMVDRLRQANIVRSEAVQRVMNEVDRQYYCPIGTPSSMFYQDSPLSIGLGQTISAPHMHAHVLEEMVPYLVRNKGVGGRTRMDPQSMGIRSSGTQEPEESNVVVQDDPPRRPVGCGVRLGLFDRLYGTVVVSQITP